MRTSSALKDPVTGRDNAPIVPLAVAIPTQVTRPQPVAMPAPDSAGEDQETRTGRQPGRLRQRLIASREIRRINRRYRRQRSAFERYADQVAASGPAEDELYAVWTRR